MVRIPTILASVSVAVLLGASAPELKPEQPAVVVGPDLVAPSHQKVYRIQVNNDVMKVTDIYKGRKIERTTVTYFYGDGSDIRVEGELIPGEEAFWSELRVADKQCRWPKQNWEYRADRDSSNAMILLTACAMGEPTQEDIQGAASLLTDTYNAVRSSKVPADPTPTTTD